MAILASGYDGAESVGVRIVKRRSSGFICATSAILMLVLASGAAAPVYGSVILLAGDVDNFTPGQPADVATQRPPFDQAMAWEHNNRLLYQGKPRNFDELDYAARQREDHTFGYSFVGLSVGQLDLTQPVLLEIMMRSSDAAIDSTDFIGFQLDDSKMPAVDPGTGWAPTMSSTFLLSEFVATYGNGAPPSSGVLTQVDLRSILFDPAYPQMTVAESINQLGHLDIFVHDDTGIDYIRLSIPAPSPLLLMAAGVLAGTLMRKEKRGRHYAGPDQWHGLGESECVGRVSAA